MGEAAISVVAVPAGRCSPVVIHHAVLVGLTITFGAIGLLAGLLRWTYGATPPRPPARDPGPPDYGLLEPVADVATPGEADRLRSLLAGHGIRATVATHPQGEFVVLVFPEDAALARRVVHARG